MTRVESAPRRQAAVKIDLDQIRELLGIVGKTDITELSIESGDQKITIRKSAAGGVGGLEVLVPQAQMVAAPRVAVETAVPAAPQPPAAKNGPVETKDAAVKNGYLNITSPMVGTFYRASSPTASAFVNVGDHVNVGQTVCIIEAMKLMNDLPAEISGKVIKVCVENGSTVEYGEVLFVVDPNG